MKKRTMTGKALSDLEQRDKLAGEVK